MRLHVGGVEHGQHVEPSLRRQRCEQALPQTAPAPSVPAIVNDGRPSVLRRAALPTSATPEHVDDARDHPSIINPTGSGLDLRQVGSIRVHASSESQNSDPAMRGLHRKKYGSNQMQRSPDAD